MLRYYRRGNATATAETRRTACRLTRHGYRRCTPAAHRQAWAKRDVKAMAGMRAEIRPMARAVGGPPPPVGFTKYKG